MSDATQQPGSDTTLMGGAAPGGTDKPAGDPPAGSAAPGADKPADGDKPAGDAKPGDKPAADAKPGDKKPDDKPAGAPEKYEDFKLPEGAKADPAVMGEFAVMAKELNLSQDQAQKLVDLNAKLQAGNVEHLKAAVEEQGQKWAEDAKADKEFGGDKFDENLAVAKRALDEFGSPELKTLLVQSKLGNHPEVLRFFFRAGQAISQDGFVPGRRGAATPSAQSFYSASKMNP
jgi:hypothetical protein